MFHFLPSMAPSYKIYQYFDMKKMFFLLFWFSEVCRQSERGFHLLVHSVDQLANNIYRVNICLDSIKAGKQGIYVNRFNGC